MAEPRWPVVYRDREWPLICPFCGHTPLPEPGHQPCRDCGRLIRYDWCPAEEREFADPNHFCTDEQRRRHYHQDPQRY